MTGIQEAVAAVPHGALIGIGGNINSRRPVALALELIAQQKRDLTLLGLTAGLACDLLIGAGCVCRLRSSYTGLEIFGFAPMFRKAVQTGKLAVIEETELTVAAGLRATLAGLCFLPGRTMHGTDLVSVREDIKTVVCPYSGEELAALPAIRPDVALIHALAVDEQGNAVLGGNLSLDIELAETSSLTIVSTETVVSHEDCIRRGVDLIGLSVDKVVHAPKGAWPTSCHPVYPLDGLEIIDYLTACEKDGFEGFLTRLRRAAT